MDELVIDRAYKKSRKHNRRSADMISFEYDRCANICELTGSVKTKSYIPGSSYSFVHRRGSKPREVFAAEPNLKIVMAFLLDRIGQLIENHLSPCTYNNRIGMGVQAAVNKVVENIYACTNGYTTPAWIIKYDFKGYFPNINRVRAYNQLFSIVHNEYHGSDKDYVIYALKIACFAGTENSFRKSPIYEWGSIPDYKSVYTRSPGYGAMIGFTLWQIEASLYPIEIDDFVVNNITPYYVRYVDDSVLVTDNKEMALAMFPEYRKRLAEIGITMHPTKFYCQSYQHGVEFLGYHILPGRVHLKRRTIARAMAVAKSKERGVANFIDAINSYLGMIKATSDTKEGVKLLDTIMRKGIIKDYENLKIARA